MKTLKVRIRRGGPGENQMVYPPKYNAAELSRLALGGGPVVYSGHFGVDADATEEWCICILPDALADTYAQDPDMEIVTPAKADADQEAWRINRGDPAEVVRDPNRLMAIQTKLAAKAAGYAVDLTQEDLDALDPTKSTHGVNRQRKVSEMM